MRYSSPVAVNSGGVQGYEWVFNNMGVGVMQGSKVLRALVCGCVSAPHLGLCLLVSRADLFSRGLVLPSAAQEGGVQRPGALREGEL